MDEIAINWTIVTFASLFVGFLFNQVFKVLVKRWPKLEPLLDLKKAVIFLVALGLAVFFTAASTVIPPLDLSDPSTFSAFGILLAGYATTAFKAAQKIYDVIGKEVLEA